MIILSVKIEKANFIGVSISYWVKTLSESDGLWSPWVVWWISWSSNFVGVSTSIVWDFSVNWNYFSSMLVVLRLNKILESNNIWVSISMWIKSSSKSYNSGSMSVIESISWGSDFIGVSISIAWDLFFNISSSYSVNVWFSIKILESDLNFGAISHWCESPIKVNVLVGTIMLWCNLNISTVSVVLESFIQIDILFLSWDNSNWMCIDRSCQHFLDFLYF